MQSAGPSRSALTARERNANRPHRCHESDRDQNHPKRIPNHPAMYQMDQLRIGSHQLPHAGEIKFVDHWPEHGGGKDPANNASLPGMHERIVASSRSITFSRSANSSFNSCPFKSSSSDRTQQVLPAPFDFNRWQMFSIPWTCPVRRPRLVSTFHGIGEANLSSYQRPCASSCKSFLRFFGVAEKLLVARVYCAQRMPLLLLLRALCP